MAPTVTPSRRTPTGRRRGRPPGTTLTARAAASEPPLKKRRYIPGGAGGGGRFVDQEEYDALAAQGLVAPIARSRARETINAASPSLGIPPRERSTRTRAASGNDGFGFAAQVAASVQQADDYKPREERGWEEFHPNLDIEKSFMVFRSEEVDGIVQETISTPAIQQAPGTPTNGSETPSRQPNPMSTGTTPTASNKHDTNPFDNVNATPTRRSRRPTRDVISFYGSRPLDLPMPTTPKTPKVLPIKNQTAKERLDLKQPSYRKTNRIELFESKTFGQARYVDKAMSNVGYQESDHYNRPEQKLIKAADANAEEDPEQSSTPHLDDANHSKFFRVEYDMDEQDDMWLEYYNRQRKGAELETITREVFEITMTKIEKEWHALEKRIPKPNPKPPQTHRPRSSSAAAVNGEPQVGEEPDTKCAICDDGDCENTNAIVFCDGCNLAVHQECYGVPFIPEGQWLCRKCQSCGRGVPTCIFCPSTDGAFKQTSSSKWAHLLCAMWIPEVSLGNHTFMEPVMEVEKVPRTRWKLNCYICHQKMGACIQCGNKNCYQAFHVTCARRARLYLKMKTPTGQLAVLDGSMVLKAFCDKHCPPDYTMEHNVADATRAAKKFFKRNMKGRIWADNHAVASVLAAQHREAVNDNAIADNQSLDTSSAGDKKKGQQHKNVWRLPSGAPVIPQAVFDTVEASLQKFPFRKRKDYLSEACRYWTLKREARRGAALLKRLQLQMDSFTSMELTRRNFAAMGPDGKGRLARRIDFAKMLIDDLERLKTLSEETVQREQWKLESAEIEQSFVDEVYFPVSKILSSAVDKAISLDKDLFNDGLLRMQRNVEQRKYAKALAFATELGEMIHQVIVSPPGHSESQEETESPKHSFKDIRERRRLGKRILKAVQPQLEDALRIESGITNKPFADLQKDLDVKIEASLDTSEAAVPLQNGQHAEGEADEDEDAMDTDVAVPANKETDTSAIGINGEVSKDIDMPDAPLTNGVQDSTTPPNSNGYGPSPARKTRATHNHPPSPPQSNGSLGKDADPLSDGGILWYFQSLQPRGTSIVDPESSERKANVDGEKGLRGQSEDLTDLDDEELKKLGREVGSDLKTEPTATEGSDIEEDELMSADPEMAEQDEGHNEGQDEEQDDEQDDEEMDEDTAPFEYEETSGNDELGDTTPMRDAKDKNPRRVEATKLSAASQPRGKGGRFAPAAATKRRSSTRRR